VARNRLEWRGIVKKPLQRTEDEDEEEEEEEEEEKEEEENWENNSPTHS
jgi:hypothetical protein